MLVEFDSTGSFRHGVADVVCRGDGVRLELIGVRPLQEGKVSDVYVPCTFDGCAGRHHVQCTLVVDSKRGGMMLLKTEVMEQGLNV